MNYHAQEIEEKKVKHRSFNQRMIPTKLEELAKAGVYYDSKVL